MNISYGTVFYGSRYLLNGLLVLDCDYYSYGHVGSFSMIASSTDGNVDVNVFGMLD